MNMPGTPILTAEELAARLAATARGLRARILEALSEEAGSGPFSDILQDVRTHLAADTDHDRFADMCAQTFVYGLLISRITSPETFGTASAWTAMAATNPTLAGLLERVHRLLLPETDEPDT